MWLYTRHESYQRKTLYAWLPTGIYLSLKNGNLEISHFRNLMNLAEIFLEYPSYQGFFPNFFHIGISKRFPQNG
jgi:hypothetical protein